MRNCWWLVLVRRLDVLLLQLMHVVVRRIEGGSKSRGGAGS